VPGIHCIYKRHLPLSSFSESQHHRRSRLSASERTQPSITRCRSVKPATASCSLQKPTGLFAYRSRGLETFDFFPRQILRTPRFCQRRKSLHLLSKFSSQYIAIPCVIPYIYTINQNYLRETFTKHHNSTEDSRLYRLAILQYKRLDVLDTICLLRHQWHDWWLVSQKTSCRKQNWIYSGQHCRFVIRSLLCHQTAANTVNSTMAMDMGWNHRHHQDCQSDIILDHHQKKSAFLIP